MGEKIVPLLFLSYGTTIVVYLQINSWSCKVIDSWINSSLLAFNNIKLSRGEICVANFIPPANGANYFLPKSHKLAVIKEKQAYKNSSGSKICKLLFKWFLVLVRWKITFFSPFCLASPELIVFKVDHRQKDKFFDTIYGGMWIFSFSSICYLPTRFAHRG